MRALPLLLAAITVFPIGGIAQSRPVQNSLPPQSFLVDRTKPYVYLEVVRIGPGEPKNDNEPKERIWLRLHNNCIVPIIVDTFGNDGVLDNVVANPSGDGISGTAPTVRFPTNLASALNLPPQESSSKVPAVSMPSGYGGGDVSSFATLGPGQSLYFSLPRNQVGPKWHVEIPFRFDLEVHSTLTSAYNFVALYEWDITSQVQNSKP